MNIVDLELYKWQLHRLGAFGIPKLKPRNMGISKFSWWMEYGAFISMLPRQSGKTEMLIRMAKMFQTEGQNFLFVVPNATMRNEILRRFSIDPKHIEVVMTATLSFNFKYMDTRPQHTNLLVDEYTLLHNDAIKGLFKMDWKSISMTGGLKL